MPVRNPFTDDDDKQLGRYIAEYNPGQAGRRGNLLYQRLVENAQGKWPWSSRHSWQGWRDRYVKNDEWFDGLIRKYQKKNKIRPENPSNIPGSYMNPKAKDGGKLAGVKKRKRKVQTDSDDPADEETNRPLKRKDLKVKAEKDSSMVTERQPNNDTAGPESTQSKVSSQPPSRSNAEDGGTEKPQVKDDTADRQEKPAQSFEPIATGTNGGHGGVMVTPDAAQSSDKHHIQAAGDIHVEERHVKDLDQARNNVQNEASVNDSQEIEKRPPIGKDSLPIEATRPIPLFLDGSSDTTHVVPETGSSDNEASHQELANQTRSPKFHYIHPPMTQPSADRLYPSIESLPSPHLHLDQIGIPHTSSKTKENETAASSNLNQNRSPPTHATDAETGFLPGHRETNCTEKQRKISKQRSRSPDFMSQPPSSPSSNRSLSPRRKLPRLTERRFGGSTFMPTPHKSPSSDEDGAKPVWPPVRLRTGSRQVDRAPNSPSQQVQPGIKQPHANQNQQPPFETARRPVANPSAAASRPSKDRSAALYGRQPAQGPSGPAQMTHANVEPRKSILPIAGSPFTSTTGARTRLEENGSVKPYGPLFLPKTPVLPDRTLNHERNGHPDLARSPPNLRLFNEPLSNGGRASSLPMLTRVPSNSVFQTGRTVNLRLINGKGKESQYSLKQAQRNRRYTIAENINPKIDLRIVSLRHRARQSVPPATDIGEVRTSSSQSQSPSLDSTVSSTSDREIIERLGTEAAIMTISKNQGFQEEVTWNIYKATGSLTMTDEILRGMRRQAEEAALKMLAQLSEQEADLPPGSESTRRQNVVTTEQGKDQVNRPRTVFKIIPASPGDLGYTPPENSRAGRFARLVRQGRFDEAVRRDQLRRRHSMTSPKRPSGEVGPNIQLPANNTDEIAQSTPIPQVASPATQEKPPFSWGKTEDEIILTVRPESLEQFRELESRLGDPDLMRQRFAHLMGFNRW